MTNHPNRSHPRANPVNAFSSEAGLSGFEIFWRCPALRAQHPVERDAVFAAEALSIAVDTEMTDPHAARDVFGITEAKQSADNALRLAQNAFWRACRSMVNSL